MQWTESPTAEDSYSELETQLWGAANQLWANAALKPSEFSPIVLGLIFLRYADVRFQAVAEEIQPKAGTRRKIGPTDYHAAGVLYLPEDARFASLLRLPEGAALGDAMNEAMRAVERENPDLADVLPKTYQVLENRTLAELLKVMASIPMDRGGDTFGLIYEYFLGKFAMSEGQKGGEFYTPTSLVRLIVEILEPFHGRIYDPACGSGGMFVQSARFLENHQKNPTAEISVHGQERVTETSRLARLNLAVHGLAGDIRQGNTYYEDLHDSVGRFDFVMANPPFNVSKIDKDRIADDPRYALGLPRTDNGNYLWIQHFHSALNAGGRAGFVMANSAADARSSEQDIRQKLIESGHVDVMVSIGSNFFYTVTLPCTLWFLDKGKAGTDREDQVLFLDARHVYRQLDRAHRDFTPAQIEFLSNVVRLYRGEEPSVAQSLLDIRSELTNHVVRIHHANSGVRESGENLLEHTLTHLKKWCLYQDQDTDCKQVLNTLKKLEPAVQEIKQRGEILHQTMDAYRSSCDDAAETQRPAQIFGRVASTTDRLKGLMPELIQHLEQVISVINGLLECRDKLKTQRGFAAQMKEWNAIFDTGNLVDIQQDIIRNLSGIRNFSELIFRYTELFPDGAYQDLPGLCKAASRAKIEAQGWSLNPGRYVGVAKGEEVSDEKFAVKLEALNEELEVLNAEAHELEEKIAANVVEILEG